MRSLVLIFVCASLVSCSNSLSQQDKSHQPVEPSVISAQVMEKSIPNTNFYVEFVRDKNTLSKLYVEIPLPREYSIGFSGRNAIGDQGMLFLYPNGQTGPFWMKNTHFNLDIAWIDSNNKIMGIDTMLADTEKYHYPPRRYFAALEVPEGWYIRNGIQIGDTVNFHYDPEDVGLKQ